MVIRLLDILFSALALILLLPLFIPVALILRLTGEGEIFFCQKRVGKGSKLFNLLKFATMLKDSPSIGSGTVTLKDDPRVLPFGKFLRKTKINELPQLANILVGDMSVVGPRPQTPRCFEVFPKDLQPIISSVRPGLSGLGPVVFRDEENILSENSKSVDFYDQVIAPYKGDVEAYYIKVISIFSYFKIIFLTLWVVIFPKSSLVWKVFPKLPSPPQELKSLLNFSR
ncbi:sugar transferase [Opitutales bacterium]|nr:sugar transferase [Opitutales bacterium]